MPVSQSDCLAFHLEDQLPLHHAEGIDCVTRNRDSMRRPIPGAHMHPTAVVIHFSTRSAVYRVTQLWRIRY